MRNKVQRDRINKLEDFLFRNSKKKGGVYEEEI